MQIEANTPGRGLARVGTDGGMINSVETLGPRVMDKTEQPGNGGFSQNRHTIQSEDLNAGIPGLLFI